jgi:hypothetical protein
MATLTVFPDASTGATTVDGTVAYSNGIQTFTNVRTQAGTVHDATSAGTNFMVYLQASTTVDNYTELFRFIATFDTSPLTSLATISSAVISLFGKAQQNTIGSPALHVAGSTPAVNNDLANADYGQCQTTTFGNIAYASWNTAAYNDITLNASGLSNISKTGISKFSWQLSWDILNSFTGTWVSNGESGFGFFTADSAGTTNDPMLVITYTLPSTSIPISNLLMLGVG